MSEEKETSVGKIVIDITDQEIKYETEMSTPEVVFWLEAVKAMVLSNVLSPTEADL